MRRTIILAVAVLMLGLSHLPAWGHDYWLMPQSFTPPPHSLLEVAFSCGHKYFLNQSVPDVTRFRPWLIVPGGRQMPLAWRRVTSSEAWLTVPLLGPGTYVVCATATAPEYWSRTAQGWRPGGKHQVPGALETGKYLKSVKTFLQVGRPSDDYRRLLGAEIELLPLADPTTLKPGQTLPVQLWFRGRPLAGVEVMAVPRGFQPASHGQAPVKAKTDDKGTARLKLDKPGTWLVYARHEIPTPGSPLADRENYRPYLLFELK